MRIVIPMAGKSERFFRAGYEIPKMLLPVGNKRLIEAIVNLFDPSRDSYVFVVARTADEHFGISRFLKTLNISSTIFTLPSHSLGPLYSLLAIAEYLPPDEEVIITYCDFLLQWKYHEFLAKVQEGEYDGGIPSFRGFHPASLGTTYYAYLQVNEQNEFLELREKMPFTEYRMQEHASTGTYYFKKWKYLTEYGQQIIDAKLKVGNEYYPSVLYNVMREHGKKILVFEVEKFICLGTPEDYEQYRFWRAVFLPEKKNI